MGAGRADRCQAHPASAVVRAQQLPADPLAGAALASGRGLDGRADDADRADRAARGAARRRPRLPARPGPRDRGGLRDSACSAARRLYRRAPGRLWLAAAALRPGIDDLGADAPPARRPRRRARSGSAGSRTGSTPARSGRSSGPSRLRRTLGLRADQLVVLYAGNMGEKQGLEGLATVADRLADAARDPARPVRRRRGAGAARAADGRALERAAAAAAAARATERAAQSRRHPHPAAARARRRASPCPPSSAACWRAAGRSWPRPRAANWPGPPGGRHRGGTRRSRRDGRRDPGAGRRCQTPPAARPGRPAVRRGPSRSRADHRALHGEDGGGRARWSARPSRWQRLRAQVAARRARLLAASFGTPPPVPSRRR